MVLEDLKKEIKQIKEVSCSTDLKQDSVFKSLLPQKEKTSVNLIEETKKHSKLMPSNII